jgi:hypothetical protein
METKRKGFIFYGEWWEYIKDIPDAERLECLESIICYGVSGEEKPPKSAVAKMAYKFISRDIKKAAENYDAKCEKNRANGKLGGRPKKPFGFSENHNNNHNDNHKDKDKDNNKNNNSPPGGEEMPVVVDAENFLNKFIDMISAEKENYCSVLGCSLPTLSKYANAVFDEWRLTGEKEITIPHFLNHIRKKMAMAAKQPKQSLDEWRAGVVQSTINELRNYKNGTFANEPEERPF